MQYGVYRLGSVVVCVLALSACTGTKSSGNGGAKPAAKATPGASTPTAEAPAAPAETITSTVTTTNPSPAPLNRAALTGPATLHRGRCVSYNLALQDTGGAPSNAAADLEVEISGAGPQGAFYSDDNCTDLISKVAIPSGSSTPADGSAVYYKNTNPGVYTVTLAAPGTDSTNLSLSVTVPPATQLHWSGPSSSNTVSCAELTIALQDTYGEASPVTDPMSVDLTDGTAVGSYYSDATCSVPVSNATIASGQSSTAVHYRQTSSGNVTLHAAVTGLAPVDHSLSIATAPPSQLVMSGGASMTTASCSPYSIIARDALGAVANAADNLSITLSPSIGAFYTTSACSGAGAITSTQISAGTNSVTVYFASLDVGTATLSASTPGLSAASRTVTVSEAPANQLALSGPGSITTTNCSAYVVTSQDANHQVRAVTSALAVTLTSSDAAGIFYSNTSCSVATSSTTLATGTSSRTVYYRKTTAGPTNLQADATDFSPGQLSVTATQGPAATLSISAAPPAPITVANCTPLSVTLQDAYGNVANAPSNLSIALSGAGTSGAFYSNSGCTTAVSSVTIAASSASANFYYKKTAPGAVTLLASRSGMTTAQRALTINAAGASSVVYSTFTTPIPRNGCRTYTAQLRDVASNVVSATSAVSFALADGADGTFYSNSTCTTVTTSLTIAAGQSAGTFYYKRPTAGTANLSMTGDGFPVRTQAVVVSSGLPTKLVLGVAPSPIAQTTCNSFRINTQDEQSIDAVVAAATTITASGLGADGALYSNSTCTTALVSPVVAAGQSSVTFYYRKATTGTVTLAFASTGLTSVSKSTVVSSGNVTNVAWTAGAASIKISTCSSYTISTRDEASLVRPVTASTLVTLSGAGTGGALYSNSTCTAEITDFTLAVGASAKTLYYMRPTTGSVTLRADSAGLTSGTKAVAITVGSPVRIGVSAGLATLPAETCSAYTLSFYDSASNVVPVAANTTLALSSTVTGLEIFGDENCTSLATSVLVPSGQSAQVIYLKGSADHAGQSGNLGAAATGLTAAAYAIQIAP